MEINSRRAKQALLEWHMERESVEPFFLPGWGGGRGEHGRQLEDAESDPADQTDARPLQDTVVVIARVLHEG